MRHGRIIVVLVILSCFRLLTMEIGVVEWWIMKEEHVVCPIHRMNIQITLKMCNMQYRIIWQDQIIWVLMYGGHANNNQ